MKRLRWLSAVLAIALCLAPCAWAWNAGGHMLTAAIAYDALQKQNPQALAAIIAILKQHPQYDRWARQLAKVDAENQDQALFMLAARWPDDIRRNPDYDHPTWHYIDYPYKPPGQPDSVQTVDPPDPNIETAFRANVDIVKGDHPAADKAVALCWIIHLMGDSHQPLHSVSLFSTDYPAPEGDKGGNQEFVRAKAGGEPIKLHAFWDGLLTGSDDTREIRKLAIELRTKYPLTELDPHPDTNSPASFASWIQESVNLAKTNVYQDGKLQSSPHRDAAPVLPPEYVQQAKALGEQRVTLAGYRMADILAQLVQ